MSRYQLFPPTAGQAREMLEEDIKARGVMVPVEIDENGNVLDGHTRIEIAKKCGKSYKTIIRRFDSEEQKREHVIMLNLARRQMADHTWGEAFIRLCKVKGVRLGSGKGNPQQSKLKPKAVTMTALAEQCGVSEATARRRMKAAREYETLPVKQARVLATGPTPTIAKVRQEYRRPRAATNKEGYAQCPKCGHWFRPRKGSKD